MHSRLSRLAGALIAVVVAIGTQGALAGPNKSGTLLIGELTSFNGTCASPCAMPECWEIAKCSQLQTRAEDEYSHWLVVLATFPPESSPRLSGVAFGLSYDPSEILIEYETACTIGTENSDSRWPSPGTGTVVTLDTVASESETPVYFLVARNYYGTPNSLSLVPHPVVGATFLDDSKPAESDTIADLGSFGFGVDGHRPCADAPQPTIPSSWGSIKQIYRATESR